jgi:cell fate regulator YaaT (PSP1 superfamily)
MEIGTQGILEMERSVGADEAESSEQDHEKDKKAFDICRQKILEHGIDMKLVSAHHLFGEPKILFFFTAESRVDFRELVKNLVAIFRTRIELRQIGVRDESRVLGGIGVCGRGYCCHALTDKLNPVSIKMAKKQNLSLNSLKISGPCGRLLCCLSYEYPYYKEIKDNLPSEGSRVQMNGERCKVLEINILSRSVKLSCEDARFVEVPFEQLHYDEQRKRWTVR